MCSVNGSVARTSADLPLRGWPLLRWGKGTKRVRSIKPADYALKAIATVRMRTRSRKELLHRKLFVAASAVFDRRQWTFG